MSFRIVSISEESRLSLRQAHLVVKQDKLHLIFIKEISVLILESQKISLTVPLLNCLIDNNVLVIVCDRKHNPNVLCTGLQSNTRRSKNIKKQIEWDNKSKEFIWQSIVKRKIVSQAIAIKEQDKEVFSKLIDFSKEVTPGDRTNREGHAAKIYFNRMFYKGFTRDSDHAINSALNFGYQIIHSCLTRDIVSKGYITEVGIFHRNEYNPHNLASDLIEPYRPIIDMYVKVTIKEEFNKQERDNVIRILNTKVLLNNKKHRLVKSIGLYVDSVINAIELGEPSLIIFPEVIESELQNYANDCNV